MGEFHPIPTKPRNKGNRRRTFLCPRGSAVSVSPASSVNSPIAPIPGLDISLLYRVQTSGTHSGGGEGSSGIAIVLATQSARAHVTPDIVRDNATPILGEVGGMNQQVVGAVLGSALQFFKETFEREGQNWISSINRYCWVCKLTGGIKHVKDGKEVPAIQTVMGSSVRVEGDIFYPPYVSKSSILNPSGPWPELPELVKKRLNLLGVNPYTLGILPWPDYTSFIEATKWALTEVIREAVVQA